MTYGNTFSNEGIAVGGSVTPLKWLVVRAAVVPHHDSAMGYTTCYSGGLDFVCTSHISITAALSNRPVYREPERRLRGGVKFTEGNLWVHPELSIPDKDGKSVRVLVSMGYTF